MATAGSRQSLPMSGLNFSQEYNTISYLCLHNALWYMFAAVATAITVPTAAQYIFCISNRLGTPSPIDILPMLMSILADQDSGISRGVDDI